MKIKHSLIVSKCCFFSIVLLVMTFTGCKKDDPPVVGRSVTASFTYDLQPNCPTPCQVCFSNTSQNAASYSWDFGNGQTSTEASPCITYTARGTFIVTLTAVSGTETSTTTRTLTIQDNVQRYKRTFAANSYGTVTNLLNHNGLTYVLMQVDGFSKMIMFNGNGEAAADFPGSISVNDMVADPDGGILCAGNYGFPAAMGIAKLTSDMTLNFERIYNFGYTSRGFSVVPKNTNSAPGYIIAGQKEDGTSSQAYLVNTFDNGDLYFGDPVEFSHTVKRIFRNPDSGLFSYIAFGEWYDPFTQKSDIHVFSVNENGVDYLPINAYIGLDNAYNDAVADIVQYGNGTSYAGIGSVGGKPTFFTINYQNQSFTQPVVVQGFSSNSLGLSGVCAMADNQGFGVCGTETTGPNFGDIGIFVARIDNAGHIVWKKNIENNISSANDIIATPDGGFLVGGQEYCTDLTCNYPVLYKLDGNGDFQ